MVGAASAITESGPGPVFNRRQHEPLRAPNLAHLYSHDVTRSGCPSTKLGRQSRYRPLTGLSTTRFMRAIAGVRGLARSSRVTGPFETSDRSRAEGNRGSVMEYAQHVRRVVHVLDNAVSGCPIFGDEIET
jgi:hypothetical protein